MSKKLYLCGVAVALATAIACGSGDKSPSPVSPSAGARWVPAMRAPAARR